MVDSNIPQNKQRFGLYINGQQQQHDSDDTIGVEYPLTGKEWAEASVASQEDVAEAVDNAYHTFQSDQWQGLTATERGEILFDIADAIEEHIDELARLETLSNARLLSSSLGQLESVPDLFRYYGGLADKVSGRTPESTNNSIFIFTQKEPYGVVGAITPWNGPIKLAAMKIAPALAAGNTVVLKPSEMTPVSSIRFAEILTEAGLPSGALNVVNGYGDAGKALVDDDRVRKVAFTGGLNAGQKVGSGAGENISSVVLELGGKSPNIVFDDANLERAVDGSIKAIFPTAGQSCVAGSRLFVHQDIHDEFVEKLTAEVADLNVGDPFDEENDMPPIATADQFEKVKQYVEIGKEEGATIEVGGREIAHEQYQYLYEPTVFSGVTNDMRLAQEEVFGPVLAVIPFESEDEVIQLANETKYGLAAGIWTQDVDRAIRMSESVEAGIIWVNTYREYAHEAPFGGYKKSGVGREMGVESIDEYLQTKTVRIKKEH